MRCSSDGGPGGRLRDPTGMETRPAYFSMFHAVSQTVPMAGTNERTMHIYNHVIPYIYMYDYRKLYILSYYNIVIFYY